MNAPTQSEVADFCARAGLPAPTQMVQLPGGGNNQVFRLDGPAGPALLKAYFRHPDDPRDRLGTEYAFCRFAWDAGIRCLPRPLAADAARGWGLYEFIEGRSLVSADVTWPRVEQALAFYRELNRHKSDPAARQLNSASEACFTLRDHLDFVELRMRRFDQLDRSTPAGVEAAKLVSGQLIPAWQRVRGDVVTRSRDWGLPLDAPIGEAVRCLSPSDFGFHNSIERQGRLAFIDFEYAGWDDPAKTIADFFCQPNVVVPPAFFDRVAEAIAADLPEPAQQFRRFHLLLAVHRVKWCCIMLNEFLPVGSRRRSFAAGGADLETSRLLQLQKVHKALLALRE